MRDMMRDQQKGNIKSRSSKLHVMIFMVFYALSESEIFKIDVLTLPFA